ncbi:MAG: oxidoreductase [Desulfitobacterium sp.]|nr:oxidoreductase [Desulfitobacterium sp.]
MVLGLERGVRIGTMSITFGGAVLGILYLLGNIQGGFPFDGLTTYFLFLLLLGQGISSLYGMGYMKKYEGKKSLTAFSLAWLVFLGSMAGVLIVNHGFYFLFLWELMSLFSFFLVIYHHEESANRRGAFIYFVMTHVGTVFLIAAVLYLFSKTGSFLYSDWAAFAPALTLGERNLLFLCFVVGFGTKAGLVPFHIWLPYAHPVAPSPVSALMSGVMVKIALYMMIRMVWLTLGPVELWWGILLLLLGALSAFVGILYASVEKDVKGLLAYSTVENIGILTLALGTAMIAQLFGFSQLVTLALVGFFWHSLHHLLFKSTLFMAAGNIIQTTNTRNIEDMGGLLKKIPKTGLWAIAGGMGLAALPPLGGFWGEWLLLNSLWKTSLQVEGVLSIVLPLVIGVVALVSALALATMAKWFSGAFLGQPRSQNAAKAKELPWMQTTAMGLAICVTVLTVLWPQGLLGVINIPLEVLSASGGSVVPLSTLSIYTDFLRMVVSFALLLVLIVGALFLISKRKQKRIEGTWNCGVPLNPRMQYTALGITMPLQIVFKKIVAFRPVIRKEVGKNPYILESMHYQSRTGEMAEKVFYRPFTRLFLWCAERIRVIQAGSIHLYLAYILITLIVVLIWNI